MVRSVFLSKVKKRARIKRYVETDSHFQVEVQVMEENITKDIENEALVRTVKIAFDNYVRLNKRIEPEMLLQITSIEDESKLADTLVGNLTNLKLEDKQKLLEEASPRKRLEDIYGYIQSEIEISRVEKKIRMRVKKQMEKTQKEYYLNEQMQAIQKELGDKDDARAELHELEQLLASKKVSKEARTRLTKEIRKLKIMSPMSAEATVLRNYIETVLDLPWGEHQTEIKSLNYAERILNDDHYGLEKVKDRVLEYLSVSALVDNPKGPILCLAGPPGVGKTSLAKSIAKATGRDFIRMSLGGVNDEAEIRGHRRTYIGSMPGKIIQSIKKAGSANPVILLDEIDKLGSSHRGDPAAALLEVLDPEQNSTFQDHYLDMEFDLSKVLFIATANVMQNIPGPLLDRLEIITLSGYTETEKVAIAKQYLVKKQIKNNGLEKHKISLAESAIKELVRYYTRESGVRNLEREIGSLFRKAARKHLKGTDFAKYIDDSGLEKYTSKETLTKEEQKELTELKAEVEKRRVEFFESFVMTEKINEKSVSKYLGARRHRIGLRNSINEVGICTGMAWTQVGGDLLEVEIVILPGKGNLKITGKLGEVMQESAQAALSYVRSRADFLDLEDQFYSKIDIHIHVPEGAIPKDGPSAGTCMATALTSALTGRPVSRFVAMTGEVTLRGRVLPIGGLKEKSLAAHRGGITKILIPFENKKDIEDIPKKIRNELEIIPVDHMDTVLLHALAWDDALDTKAKDDELFKKLKEIADAEVQTAEFPIAH